MLSDEMLRLLRQWWKARPSRYDAGIPLQERWLFPSRKSAAGRSPLAIFRILRCPGEQR
jgi:integrase